LGGWVRNTISEQGSLIIEHFLDKIADFSIQLDIKEDRIRLFEVRQFMTGQQNQYRGTYLGKATATLTPDEQRFFFEALPKWRQFVRDLGSQLRDEGYQGPAGVDALLWRGREGRLHLKPLVELNPRWTMGRVALALEKHLFPGVPGVWKFVSLSEIQRLGFKTFQEFAIDLQNMYPAILRKSGGSLRLASGVLFTNDPLQARSSLTVLSAS